MNLPKPTPLEVTNFKRMASRMDDEHLAAYIEILEMARSILRSNQKLTKVP